MVKSIENLNVDEWIVYQTKEGNKYGQIVYFSFSFASSDVEIIVESVDGMQYQISEHVVLEKVSKHISKELSIYKNTMEEKAMATARRLNSEEKKKLKQYNTGGLTTSQEANKVPTHYQGKGEIDLIEFFYQQWGMEALKAVVSFNIQRYALRLGRKDEETQELKKIIDYAQRFIDKKEKEND